MTTNINYYTFLSEKEGNMEIKNLFCDVKDFIFH